MPARSRTVLSHTALVLLVTLGGCAGDSLGPPDGLACTAGSVVPGDSITGALTASSCQVYGLDNYALTYAESWTLSLRRGRAYVIRLRHEADSAGFDNWAGDLVLLGRNPQGDATPLTGWFRAFGDQNANGGMNEELLLAADQDRTVSIRVAAATLADTGRYSLSVESCPAVALNDTTLRTGIDLATGCHALSIASAPMRVRMLTFPTDAYAHDTVRLARTAGAGRVYGYIAGPGVDLACWTGQCVSYEPGFDTLFRMVVVPSVPGQMTVLAAVDADSAATISAQAKFIPPALEVR